MRAGPLMTKTAIHAPADEEMIEVTERMTGKRYIFFARYSTRVNANPRENNSELLIAPVEPYSPRRIEIIALCASTAPSL